MTYRIKKASDDERDLAQETMGNERYTVYDEETGQEAGTFDSEEEAQTQCDTLNRADLDDPNGPDGMGDIRM